MISVRCSWSKNIEESSLLIADKRMVLDESISSLKEVQFLISCISGTTSNASKNQEYGKVVRPAISYFICVSDDKVRDKIFATLHDKGVDADVTTLQKKKKSGNTTEMTMACLKQVLKVLIT